jgi:hypothetical protein
MARLFRKGKGEAAPDASRELARRVRALLGLPEDATVSVTEIVCGDPACGGAETAIIVMRPGRRTEFVKLMQPVATVGEDELRRALAKLAEPATKT